MLIRRQRLLVNTVMVTAMTSYPPFIILGTGGFRAFELHCSLCPCTSMAFRNAKLIESTGAV